MVEHPCKRSSGVSAKSIVKESPMVTARDSGGVAGHFVEIDGDQDGWLSLAGSLVMRVFLEPSATIT